MRYILAALAAVLTIMPDFEQAAARPLRGFDPVIVVPELALPPLEAKGCYYYRGRRHCGSYCYWEVNGRRYCQPREHDAFPQADAWLEVLEPEQEKPSHGRRARLK